jgi:hypothetical protein
MRKVTSSVTAPASKELITKAETGLTGIHKAAMAAGRRMSALEEQAEALHAKTLLSCTARVVSTQQDGVHALITDHHGVTVEIAGGELAVAVAQLD